MQILHDKYFPLKIIYSKHTPVPWMNDTIKTLMKQRDQFYKMFKNNKKRSCKKAAYNAYRVINNQVKKEINNAKRIQFTEKYKSAIDLKSRWNLVHSFGITRKSKKKFDQNMQSNNQITANSLNNFFLRNNGKEG